MDDENDLSGFNDLVSSPDTNTTPSNSNTATSQGSDWTTTLGNLLTTGAGVYKTVTSSPATSTTAANVNTPTATSSTTLILIGVGVLALLGGFLLLGRKR